MFVYVTGLTYVSTLEDREGHRARLWTGVAAMILGALLAASVGVWNAALFSGLATSYNSGEGLRWGVPPAALAVSLALVAGLIYRARGAKDRRGIMLVVRDGIGGIILLESSVVVSKTGDLWLGLALVSLIVPAVISVAIFKKLA